MVSLVKSHRVAVAVVKRLDLVANSALVSRFRDSGAASRVDITEWLADDLLTRVDANFTEGTNVLTIKYKSNSAIQAAQIANTFLAVFIDAAVEMKIAAAQQTAQWFEPQTEKLRTELAAARGNLAKFQHDSQLLVAERTGDSQGSAVIAVTNDLLNAKAELMRTESQMQATAGNAGGGTTDIQVTDSPLITTIKGKLAQVNQEIGSLRTLVGSNNPKSVTLLEARKSLQEQLRAEIATNRQETVRRTAALKDQIEFLEKARSAEVQKMIDLQDKRYQLSSLEREVEFRQQQLQNVEKSAGAARMQSQLALSNLSILDTATPPLTPAFPKLNLVIVAPFGSGLFLGVIFALLAEALDRRIRVASDLEFAGSMLVLGTLAKSPPSRRRVLKKREERGRLLSAARPAADVRAPGIGHDLPSQGNPSDILLQQAHAKS
jgi:succinoglycan biosynthesis transport protein ExoP